MANITELDMYRTAARLGCGLPMPVRDFERRAGVQTRLALTAQVGLGQMGVDLLYRFGGPVFIAREWDRHTTPDGFPYDAIALDLSAAAWIAPDEWWSYVCDLDRARLAASQPGPVHVDPNWRPRPRLEQRGALEGRELDVLIIDGEWHDPARELEGGQ
jgi:hypothetical protein